MNTVEEKMTEDRLAALGLNAAAEKVKEARELKRKMAIAYEHYRFVSPEKIADFQKKLRAKTEQRHRRYRGSYSTYDQLAFTPMTAWQEVPPEAALIALEEAQKKGCFDFYEVANIKSVTEVPDPILFGCISGCGDKFFIAQWDDDVRIEDILDKNEG